VGDLLVSFTKDQGVLDDALPDAIYYAGIYSLILLATTITVSVTIPFFSLLAGGLFAVSGFMLYLYLPAATHLKKLRMGTSGDLVTLVSEALDGLTVIQAYGKQAYFTHITSECVDDSHRWGALLSPPGSPPLGPAAPGWVLRCAASHRRVAQRSTHPCRRAAHPLPPPSPCRALFGAESLNLWLAFFCDFFGATMVGLHTEPALAAASCAACTSQASCPARPCPAPAPPSAQRLPGPTG
jgi:hypothetical protein